MGFWKIWSSWRCPDHCKEVGLDDLEKTLSTQTILLFYNGQSQKDTQATYIQQEPSINQWQIAVMFQACKLLQPTNGQK